jgi:short-subunit dehydrogenase
MDLRSRWVLVTGASSGLGLEMARELARDHKANLIAVARRAERLEALKTELQKDYGVQVVTMQADLAKPEDVQRVFTQATTERDVYGVILNAGVTFYGHVLDQPGDSIEAMLATNVSSVVRLARSFADDMVQRRSDGGIMLVSSMASFAPMPFQTSYAATKSFITSFGRGLSHELRGTGVSVTVFAPGGIATEMLEISGLSRKFKAGDFGIMPANKCAHLAIKAFRSRRPLSVPGAANQMLAAAMKLFPHSLVIDRISAMYKGSLPPRAGSGGG